MKRKWTVVVQVPIYWSTEVEVEAETQDEAEDRAENIFMQRGLDGFTWNKGSEPDAEAVQFSADHAQEDVKPGGFKATHRITFDGKSFEVMLEDDADGNGPAYTASEWENATSADWEVHGGEWMFHGRIVNHEVEKLE